MNIIRTISAAIRFVLEVVIVIAACYCGRTVPTSKILKGVIGIGVPVLIILVWARFGAPKSPDVLIGEGKLALEIIMFTIGTLSFWFMRKRGAAVLFAVMAFINTVVLYML